MPDSKLKFEEFLSACAVLLKGENGQFVPLIRKRYDSCSPAVRASPAMVQLLEDSRRRMRQEKHRVFVHVRDVVCQLKAWSSENGAEAGGRKRKAALPAGGVAKAARVEDSLSLSDSSDMEGRLRQAVSSAFAAMPSSLVLTSDPVHRNAAPLKLNSTPVQHNAVPVKANNGPVEHNTAPLKPNNAPFQLDSTPLKLKAAYLVSAAQPSVLSVSSSNSLSLSSTGCVQEKTVNASQAAGKGAERSCASDGSSEKPCRKTAGTAPSTRGTCSARSDVSPCQSPLPDADRAPTSGAVADDNFHKESDSEAAIASSAPLLSNHGTVGLSAENSEVGPSEKLTDLPAEPSGGPEELCSAATTPPGPSKAGGCVGEKRKTVRASEINSPSSGSLTSATLNSETLPPLTLPKGKRSSLMDRVTLLSGKKTDVKSEASESFDHNHHSGLYNVDDDDDDDDVILLDDDDEADVMSGPLFKDASISGALNKPSSQSDFKVLTSVTAAVTVTKPSFHSKSVDMVGVSKHPDAVTVRRVSPKPGTSSASSAASKHPDAVTVRRVSPKPCISSAPSAASKHADVVTVRRVSPKPCTSSAPSAASKHPDAVTMRRVSPKPCTSSAPSAASKHPDAVTVRRVSPKPCTSSAPSAASEHPDAVTVRRVSPKPSTSSAPSAASKHPDAVTMRRVSPKPCTSSATSAAKSSHLSNSKDFSEAGQPSTSVASAALNSVSKSKPSSHSTEFGGERGATSTSRVEAKGQVKDGEAEGEETEEPMSRKEQKHVKRLEKLLERIRDKIEQLREKELTLDDLEEEDSSYIFEDKLQRKFVKVWTKLCQLKGQTTASGRPLDKKFKYQGTRFPEINRKIQKFVNRPDTFPDYHDIRGIVKKVDTRCKLRLTANQINEISREAFLDVGEGLQKQRHEDFIGTFNNKQTMNYSHERDPALFDDELRRKLEENQSIGKSRLEAVITKYSNIQMALVDEDEDEGSESKDEEVVKGQGHTGVKDAEEEEDDDSGSLHLVDQDFDGSEDRDLSMIEVDVAEESYLKRKRSHDDNDDGDDHHDYSDDCHDDNDSDGCRDANDVDGDDDRKEWEEANDKPASSASEKEQGSDEEDANRDLHPHQEAAVPSRVPPAAEEPSSDFPSHPAEAQIDRTVNGSSQAVAEARKTMLGIVENSSPQTSGEVPASRKAEEISPSGGGRALKGCWRERLKVGETKVAVNGALDHKSGSASDEGGSGEGKSKEKGSALAGKGKTGCVVSEGVVNTVEKGSCKAAERQESVESEKGSRKDLKSSGKGESRLSQKGHFKSPEKGLSTPSAQGNGRAPGKGDRRASERGEAEAALGRVSGPPRPTQPLSVGKRHRPSPVKISTSLKVPKSLLAARGRRPQGTLFFPGRKRSGPWPEETGGAVSLVDSSEDEEEGDKRVVSLEPMWRQGGVGGDGGDETGGAVSLVDSSEDEDEGDTRVVKLEPVWRQAGVGGDGGDVIVLSDSD